MNRNNFYIFQNQEGKIYAYTDDFKQVCKYIDEAIEQGFKYVLDQKGIAAIYTIYKEVNA